VHYHFNSPVTVYARVSWFTRAASSQPGHWLGPVTRLGRLGPAQTIGLIWTQPKKKKQIICPIPFILFLFVLILIRPNKYLFYIIKFQINLLTLLNLFVSPYTFFYLYNFIIYLICEFLLWNTNLICDIYLFFNKTITKKYVWFVFNSNFTGLFTDARIRNTIFFLCYVIFTNVRVGSIRIRIFTSARVKNITSRPSIV
jgi:hypothetical protein